MTSTKSAKGMGDKELQGYAGEIITFPEGMIGFENWRRFVIESDNGQPILRMVCLDDEDICFLVTSPDCLIEGYDIQMSSREQEAIGLSDAKDALVLCTLTIRQEPLRITANLAGPIVVNVKTKLAKQLVIQDERFSLHYPVSLEAEGE
ncbi:MAG: flagellar assembly protein FliW [Chloroflexi bacterium]|nr:flagellar assembly protein FliW [Chloroflexota bacterium]